LCLADVKDTSETDKFYDLGVFAGVELMLTGKIIIQPFTVDFD